MASETFNAEIEYIWQGAIALASLDAVAARVVVAATWPTHPDGTNKRVDDMTADERQSVLDAARARFAGLRAA